MYENQSLVFSSKNNLSLTQTLQNKLLEMSVDRSKKEFLKYRTTWFMFYES